jgi:hypothetical protein
LVYSIPSWISTGWFSAWAFVDFGIGAVLNGSYYHLWYLLSAIYAIPLLHLILRKIPERLYLYIAIPLYAVEILMYGNRTWLPASLSYIFSLSDKVSGITTAVFRILPFLLMGAFIYHNTRDERHKPHRGFMVSFLLLVCEAEILSYMGWEGVSYIVLTFPTAYFLFQWIITRKVNIAGSATLGKSSLMIYCVHPIIVESTAAYMPNTITHFLCVASVSTIIGLIYVSARRVLGFDKLRSVA